MRVKAVTSRVSPRAVGSTPALRHTASAAPDEPAHEASAERSILRRCANAWSTTSKTSRRAAPVGEGRLTSRTRPESTLGTGQNTERGTAPARAAAAYQATLTLGTPYALVPGDAASRSATSACT